MSALSEEEEDRIPLYSAESREGVDDEDVSIKVFIVSSLSPYQVVVCILYYYIILYDELRGHSN